MKCPVCSDVRMREVEKEGIMIDVCPDCKGVWLDRGELEKLMTGVRQIRDEYNSYVQSGYPQQHSGGYAPQPNIPYNNGGAPIQPTYGKQEKINYDPHKYGSSSSSYNSYGQSNVYGHSSKYGHKHKKSKTVFDVLGDLFD